MKTKTTITIEPDVSAKLWRLQQDSELGLKDLVNDVLRRGLRRLTEGAQGPEKSFTGPVDCGQLLIGNLDCIGEILLELDVEKYR